MIDVIFTDTHFGWKNNSQTWLTSQMDFIYKQFIPKIKQLRKKDNVRVIHCGDVFDSRSTISTYVASKVVKAFMDIRRECNEFIIIAGNHDFYSPNSDAINTIDLFMGNMGIDIVSQDVLVRDRHAFIPWYKWIDRDNLDIDADYIFCHGDILHETIPIWAWQKTIFSGHIHIPDKSRGLYNLGSCYSLNFADSNTDRGFYIMEDGDVSFIKNDVSIKFYRFYDKDILSTDISSLDSNDYIELYISELNLVKQSYIDAIKEFTERFSHIWIIPQTVKLDHCNEGFAIYDIEDIIDNAIPEDLIEFYKILKDTINSEQ